MTDRFVVRVVVIALAVSVLAGLFGLMYLAITERAIPDQLDRLITFMAGGLVGLLVRTTSDDGPDGTPVQVMNPPHRPVNVEEV